MKCQKLLKIQSGCININFNSNCNFTSTLYDKNILISSKDKSNIIFDKKLPKNIVFNLITKAIKSNKKIPFTAINISMFLTYVLFMPSIKNVATVTNKVVSTVNNKPIFIKFLNCIFDFKENNKILGAVLFNTTSSIIFSYETCRFLYPKAYYHVKNLFRKNYGLSDRSFEFFDFIFHVFPFLYLIKTYNHWKSYSGKLSTVIISLFIHSIWIKAIPGKLNLNDIYMDGNGTILKEYDWKFLWFLAIFGHSYLYIYKYIKNM